MFSQQKTNVLKHACHAEECGAAVPKRHLMCARHWFMVPKDLRDRVWATYRTGQEITKNPSPQYLEAAKACITSVKQTELLYREFDVVKYEGL